MQTRRTCKTPHNQQPKLRIEPKTLELHHGAFVLKQNLEQPKEIKICHTHTLSSENWLNFCSRRVIGMLENIYLDADFEYASLLGFHHYSFCCWKKLLCHFVSQAAWTFGVTWKLTSIPVQIVCSSNRNTFALLPYKGFDFPDSFSLLMSFLILSLVLSFGLNFFLFCICPNF